MKGVDVAVDSFNAIVKHPKYLAPQFVLILIAGLLAFIILVPLSISSASALSSSISPAVAASEVIGIVIGLVILVVIIGLISVVLTGMYVNLALKWQDQEVSISDSIKIALSRYLDILLYEILAFIIQAVVIGILLIPFILALLNAASSMTATSTPSASAVLPVLGAFLLSGILILIAEIILLPLMFNTVPIIVLEKLGPIKALQKSIAIGRSDFFGILGVLFVLGLIIAVIEFIIYVFSAVLGVAAVASAASTTAASAAPALTPALVIYQIVAIIVSIFIGTFSSLIVPIYYIKFASGNKSSPAAQPMQTKTAQQPKPSAKKSKSKN